MRVEPSHNVLGGGPCLGETDMRVTLTMLLAVLAIVPGPVWGQAAPGVEPPKLALVERRDKIIKESQKRIQEEILDRVLGENKASVWVDLQLDITANRRKNLRAGAGSAQKYKAKGGEGGVLKTEFILPGVPKQKNINKEEDKKPESAQAQRAEQFKVEEEEVFSQKIQYKNFIVKVIYDSAIPKWKTREVEIRKLIVEAMGAFSLQPDNVIFRPAKYHTRDEDSFLGQLRDPKVYIPLLYAILLFLLLSFLFGPFARFLRRYTEALMAKPAAEVNIDSSIEAPDGGGEDGDEQMQSAMELMVGRRPPPPPPPADDFDGDFDGFGEGDAMEKLEVFNYIDEENLGRLANLFQVRSEEPWLIAVVLYYLKQEYAREVLSSLPSELQAKVAMEALKVRQVTKEQILAIDEDVKQSIDYVVGGVERLIQMLEEADPQARQNILDSLQNEKPNVYEFVRRAVLLFEDLATFEDREMQVIVRELKTETMSRALHGSPPEVVNKFFNNMSAGASSLLKESMEYQQNVSQNMVDDARSEIMDQIKRFSKEGKINISQGGSSKGGFHQIIATESVRGKRLSQLSGSPVQEDAPAQAVSSPAPQAQEAASPPPVNPEEAKRAYDAGAAAQQAGQLDQAVTHFRAAIESNPELWDAYQYLGQSLYQMGRQSESVIYYEKYLQHNPDPQLRAWVDSFKTQMGAS